MTTQTLNAVTLDYNDSAFLAQLVTNYVKENNLKIEHLDNLIAKLTVKAGC